MVREMEGPTAEPVVVVVTLPVDDDAAEVVAERAFGTLVALFDRGTAVILTTTEVAGPCTGAVSDRRSAGRRLARAVAAGRDSGPPDPPRRTRSREVAAPAAFEPADGVLVTTGERPGMRTP
jgi:hypothetical protein